MRFALKLSCLILLASFVTTLAFGQVEAGSIAGTVKDATGAVVPGATVKVKNVSTGLERTAQTGSVGQYTIPALTAGTYEVSITSGSFAPFKARADVAVGGITTVDAQLAVGKESTTIEVVAQGAAEVNTQTQELSTLISPQQMAQLPSLTRNPYDFVAISGNVSNGDNTTNNASSSQNLSSRGVGYAINGQRESGTEILLDGAENVDQFGAGIGETTPVDSVQEYRIVTNNFDAQYGRASGGVVNLITKSGTNGLHGDGWEFNRLSKYTANTYNNDAQNTFCLSQGTCTASTLPLPKGVYTRNQFGFDVGGPIVKDKLFFFVANEWTRVRSNSTQSEAIFTPQFLATLPANAQSFFQAYGSTKYSIASTVNATQVEAVAGPTETTNTYKTWAAANPNFPVLGIVPFTAPFDAGGGTPQNTYSFIAKIDYTLNNSNQMFFRWGRQRENDFLGADSYSVYPQYDVGGKTANDSYLYSWSHTFSPRLFNNLKVSFTRFYAANSYDVSLQNTPNLFVGPGTSVNGALIQMPGLENVAPGLGGLPYGGPQNTGQLEDDIAWTNGKHTFKFGGQFTYMQINRGYGAYAQAVALVGDTLGGGLDNLLGIPGVTGGTQLQEYEAAVLPGILPCSRDVTGAYIITPSCEVTPPLSSPSFARSYRYKDWALFAQDSYRLTSRLTVNYGMRYEHYGVQHNGNPNLDSNFYWGPGSSYYQRVRTGSVQIADKSSVGGFWAPDWGTVAPRLGFAYDVFGDGKTSLRGGFGMSYERNFGNVTFNTIQNPPNYGVLVFDGPIPLSNSNLGPFAQPGPALPLPNVSLRQPNPGINTAQTQFWSLAVERELTRNTVFAVEYSGAHGVHLYDIRPSNPRGGGNVFLGDPFNGYYDRPNYQFSNINTRGSGGSSSYNSLNLRFQTQDIHRTGLSAVANYTWAHSLDNLSSTFSDSSQGGSGYIGNLGYLDPNHPMLDWGSSDFDVPQRLSFSPIWNTPWFKSGRSVKSEALGGWSLIGIFTARKGTPFSAFDYTYSLSGGAGYGVPRIEPATPITQYKTGSPQIAGPNVFNVLTIPGANDAAPYNTTLGISDFGPFPADMTHRNCFRGPGAWNLDMALGKSFPVTERVKLEFRAEGFDVFNHHNYYVNESLLDVSNTTPIGPPLVVTALKGGLNSIALGGNHDERRFGQFSLRVSF